MNPKHKGIIWVVGIVLALVVLRAACEGDSGKGGGWIGSCSICNGTGRVPCHYCVGGQVSKSPWGEGSYSCGVCGGDGWDRCSMCGGSGWR